MYNNVAVLTRSLLSYAGEEGEDNTPLEDLIRIARTFPDVFVCSAQ